APITQRRALPGRGRPIVTVSSRMLTRFGTSRKRLEQLRRSEEGREAERPEVGLGVLRRPAGEREVGVVVEEHVEPEARLKPLEDADDATLLRHPRREQAPADENARERRQVAVTRPVLAARAVCGLATRV